MNDDLLRLVDEGRHNENGVGHISWAFDNPTMFARIIDLYARPGMVIADVTYDKGVFWRAIDTSLYETRFTDLTMGVDVRNLPYDSDSIDMVVFDPPYRYMAAKTRGGGLQMLNNNDYNLSSLSTGTRMKDVLNLYQEGIEESARVLRRGGFLVVKCQDSSGEGTQFWTHTLIMGYLQHVGCEVVDLAVVVNSSPPPTRWKIQRSFKKGHSYFIVARKGGQHAFGYRSVQSR